MSIKLKEWHLARNVAIFEQATQIIKSPEGIELKEIYLVLDELKKYEDQIRGLRQAVFEATNRQMTKEWIQDT